jgi:LEA14-like dessication related protein
MKIFTILFTAFLLFSCSENNTLEIGQKTTLKVKPVFDAGKVLFGEEIVATFEVENTGDYPLVISEVKGSCSCTVAEKPEEPIAPGKKGVIKATVKTENAAIGKMAKEVRIVANTEPSITLMRITAEVVRK